MGSPEEERLEVGIVEGFSTSIDLTDDSTFIPLERINHYDEVTIIISVTSNRRCALHHQQ